MRIVLPTTRWNVSKMNISKISTAGISGHIVRRNAGIGGTVTTAIGGGTAITASSVTVAVIGIGTAAGGIRPMDMIRITATMFTTARSSATATLRRGT